MEVVGMLVRRRPERCVRPYGYAALEGLRVVVWEEERASRNVEGKRGD